MNNRIARKIVSRIESGRYNDFQVGKALDRVDRLRSTREDNQYWGWLMTMVNRARHEGFKFGWEAGDGGAES